MFTEHDNGRGLVRCEYELIHDRLSKICPELAKIIMDISPGKDLPVWISYPEYGSLKGDTQSEFLPRMDGGSFRLTDPNLPKEIVRELGYGIGSCPMGILIDKSLEFYIDKKSKGLTLPWSIDGPGTFFPIGRALNTPDMRTYTPNGLLQASIGARSVFMLSSIGDKQKHANLQKIYDLKCGPPKKYYDHGECFAEIASGINTEWRACILYFPEEWFRRLTKDPRFVKLRGWIYDFGWKQSQYARALDYSSHILSGIRQDKIDLGSKFSPHVIDVASHIIRMALGDSPGFSPVESEQLLPLKEVQQAYSEIYGMQYAPTIMAPSNFIIENSSLPIYYSLQHRVSHVLSQSARPIATDEIRAIQKLIEDYVNFLNSEQKVCEDTILNIIAQSVGFRYYHSSVVAKNCDDNRSQVRPPEEVFDTDPRFCGKDNNEKKVITDCRFFKGCIGISSKRK